MRPRSTLPGAAAVPAPALLQACNVSITRTAAKARAAEWYWREMLSMGTFAAKRVGCRNVAISRSGFQGGGLIQGEAPRAEIGGKVLSFRLCGLPRLILGPAVK